MKAFAWRFVLLEGSLSCYTWHMTRDLGLHSLVRGTAPLSHLVRQARGSGDLYLPKYRFDLYYIPINLSKYIYDIALSGEIVHWF